MRSKAVTSSGTIRTPGHLDGSRVLVVGVEWRGVKSERSRVGVVVTVHTEPKILLQEVLINVENSHS